MQWILSVAALVAIWVVWQIVSFLLSEGIGAIFSRQRKPKATARRTSRGSGASSSAQSGAAGTLRGTDRVG